MLGVWDGELLLSTPLVLYVILPLVQRANEIASNMESTSGMSPFGI